MSILGSKPSSLYLTLCYNSNNDKDTADASKMLLDSLQAPVTALNALLYSQSPKLDDEHNELLHYVIFLGKNHRKTSTLASLVPLNSSLRSPFTDINLNIVNYSTTISTPLPVLEIASLSYLS